MKKRVLFRETQSQRAWWLKLVMIVANIVAIGPLAYGLYSQLELGKPFGDKPMGNNGLLVLTLFVVALMIGVTWLVFYSKLIIEIDLESIQFRYLPFIRNPKVLHRGEIADFEVRTYKPVREYGGWGIKHRKLRYRLKENKKQKSTQKGMIKKITTRSIAYTINGNKGLQLYLKNGRQILIGTQHPEAMNRAMNRMMEKEV